jgi:hypothetical protein
MTFPTEVLSDSSSVSAASLAASVDGLEDFILD